MLFDTSAAQLHNFTIAGPAGGLSTGRTGAWARFLGDVLPDGAVAVHAADAGLWCGACGEGLFESCPFGGAGSRFRARRPLLCPDGPAVHGPGRAAPPPL